MHKMNISQISLVEFKIEEILNKLRRVNKNYKLSVFCSSLGNTRQKIFLDENKSFFFDP